MKKNLLFIFLFWSSVIFGQSFNMTTDARYQSCLGTLYDSGGPNSNYTGGLVQQVTICPDFPGSALQVFFTHFDLVTGVDFLEIYDGEDLNAPLLITLTGTDIPFTRVASFENTSGCLTFRFKSAQNSSATGFAANFECVVPCQSIRSFLTSSYPSRDADGIIKACIGQRISLNGDATFSNNQGNEARYAWDLEDGRVIDGQNVVVSYNEPGIYRINLIVTDFRDCKNSNYLSQTIQISPEPEPDSFVSDIEEIMCFGAEQTFTVESLFPTITRELHIPESGITFLPDGDDNIYETSIVMTEFGENQEITQGSDIKAVCINMEHSYSNDLSIRLISPNGTVVLLHNRGGAGTYIGQANDDGGLDPGIGETYCFTMDAATILINGPTIIGGFNPPNNMYVPGDYLPVQEFDRFIGSPLNGEWTLQIHDQQESDNGYIFWWNIRFDDSVLPPEYAFTPEPINYAIQGDGVTNSIPEEGKFTIKPETAGQHCYTVTMTNDFGCTFTKEFCTTVLPKIVFNEPRFFEACGNNTGDFMFDFRPVFNDLSTDGAFTFSLHANEDSARNGSNQISTTQMLNVSQGQVTFWVRGFNFITGCFEVVSFKAQVLECQIILNHLPDLSICQGETNSFNLAQYIPVVYNNNLGFNVAFYNSEQSAIDNLDPIPQAQLSNYVGVSGETIWVRVTNIANPQRFEITSFKLFIYDVPEYYNLNPLTACEIPGTGLANFDLRSVRDQASGLSPNIQITFYQTYAEAESGLISTRLPLDYTGYQGMLYIRSQNINTGCFIIMPLVINVVDTPGANTIAPLQYCDDNNDGYGMFNLEPTAVLIAGNPIPVGIEVTYHETLDDANAKRNQILNINRYQNIVQNAQTLYVRVGHVNSTCATVVPLKLIVNSRPAVSSPTPLEVCSASPYANFNLKLKEVEILNGLNATEYDITYHLTSENAQLGTNPITDPTNFSNLTANVVYVRVENKITHCFSIEKLVLKMNNPPVIDPVLPTYAICDDNFDGFQRFDLDGKIPSILGSQTGLRVTFHYINSDAVAGINPLVSPYQNVVRNVQTIYVRVERVNTGCFSISTMDIRVSPLPVLSIPTTPFEICSDTSTSFGTVDLTSFNARLLNGKIYDLNYFETEANALNNISVIPNPNRYNNLQPNDPHVWVRATNLETGCFAVYKVVFRLVMAPKMPLALPDLVECDIYGNRYDGITRFDLNTQKQIILDAQTLPGTYEIRFYLSEDLANAGISWIGNPESYINTSNPQVIWARIHNTAYPNMCYAIKSFNIRVEKPIFLAEATPILLCDNGLPNDGRNTFDLTVRENQITQGEVFGITVRYYLSETEAMAGVNPIPDPRRFTNTVNPQTIWVEVHSINGCKAYKSLTIRVLPLPEPKFNVAPLQKCAMDEGGNTAFFNLFESQAEMSNGNTTLTYKYFLTENDAINDTNAIRTPDNLLSPSVTLYVRVTNAPVLSFEQCSVIVPLRLIVNEIPLIPNLSPLYVCILNTNGIHTFNLRDKFPEILAGRNAADYDIRFFMNELDAKALRDPIAYTYTNVNRNVQEIWVSLRNIATGCYSVNKLVLKVEEKVFAYPPTESLVFCDTDGVNDGFGPANISRLDASIISIQNLTGNLAVRYYTSWANYNARNASSSNAFPITSARQLVIAEVFSTIGGSLCTATVEFYISMVKGPEIAPILNGYICPDFKTGNVVGYLMDTKLPSAGYTYSWSRDDEIITSAVSPSYMAVIAGTYTVVATSTATGCAASQTIIVQAAPAFTIDQVNVTEGFSDTNAVEVIASPQNIQLEYALDEGPYQDNNIFLNVLPGEHTVWVKVKGLDVCAASIVINVLNFPKFFTPNGDGYNDTWNIFALKDQPEAKIFIFDRQGKFLKQLSPAGAGWDGTFNGKPLPSSDYWFKAEYIEPNTGLQKEATGHFTLKR